MQAPLRTSLGGGIVIGGRACSYTRGTIGAQRQLSYMSNHRTAVAKMAVAEESTSGERKKESVAHTERTAHEPRAEALIPVKIQKVEQINSKIRLFQLAVPQSAQPVKFLPGQWLDVYCPGVPKAGGFTLTSSPSKALLPQGEDPYMELAVQKSPNNPPAAWMWGEHYSQNVGGSNGRGGAEQVLGKELRVRIGGSFTWPPPGLDEMETKGLERVVFVAGGVGVNPLVSMISHVAERREEGNRVGFDVEFLYSMKDPGAGKKASEILFLERIAKVFAEGRVKGRLRLFLTGGEDGDEESEIFSQALGKSVPFERRRVTVGDVAAALGGKKEKSVVYVCGVPGMTDEFVQKLRDPDGVAMSKERVLCEKWW